MKFLLLAFVALAAAEPESYWPYTANYLGYSGLRTYPFNTYQTGYTSYPVNTYSYIHKREAEADPLYMYKTLPFYNQQAYRTYNPVAYSQVAQPVLKSGTFHTNAQNVAKGIHANKFYDQAYYNLQYQPTHFVAKREAEADSFYPVRSVYNYPYTTTAGVYNYPSTVYPSAYYPYSNYFGIHKREAESDAYYPYTTQYVRPYSSFYNRQMYPYTFGYPYVY